ncbi:hypothetical protein MARINON1_60392 [Marinobacter salarius]|nr:hypothetical protein MBHK15_100103 [Marinobacter salarius]VXC49974.1 hypothetical protein MARINON1_60392 [Marinobacter salarius]
MLLLSLVNPVPKSQTIIGVERWKHYLKSSARGSTRYIFNSFSAKLAPEIYSACTLLK